MKTEMKLSPDVQEPFVWRLSVMEKGENMKDTKISPDMLQNN